MLRSLLTGLMFLFVAIIMVMGARIATLGGN